MQSPHPPLGERRRVPHEHVVQFYEDERFLCECVATFASGAWQQGNPVLLIATHAHRKAFKRTFKARGFNLRDLSQAGLLIWADVRVTLKPVIVHGMPDEALVRRHLGDTIESAGRNFPGRTTQVYSEIVDTLWQQGDGAAAIRFEELWNRLAERCAVSLLCACDLHHFDHQSDAEGLADVCRCHSCAVPSESYREDSAPEERRRSVLSLQQRARALETEKRQRKVLEQSLRRVLAARRSAERERAAAQVEAARAGIDPSTLTHRHALAHVSHELKTPLNAILGWTQMLAAGRPDQRTFHQAIEVIERNARALNALIDGLLAPNRRPTSAQ